MLRPPPPRPHLCDAGPLLAPEHSIKAREESKARFCGDLGVLQRFGGPSGGARAPRDGWRGPLWRRGSVTTRQRPPLILGGTRPISREWMDARSLQTEPGAGGSPSPAGVSPPPPTQTRLEVGGEGGTSGLPGIYQPPGCPARLSP